MEDNNILHHKLLQTNTIDNLSLFTSYQSNNYFSNMLPDNISNNINKIFIEPASCLRTFLSKYSNKSFNIIKIPQQYTISSEISDEYYQDIIKIFYNYNIKSIEMPTLGWKSFHDLIQKLNIDNKTHNKSKNWNLFGEFKIEIFSVESNLNEFLISLQEHIQFLLENKWIFTKLFDCITLTLWHMNQHYSDEIKQSISNMNIIKNAELTFNICIPPSKYAYDLAHIVISQ